MNIEPTAPTVKNSPEQFIGDVWVDPIAAPHEGDQRMTVALVRFAPGARTAWHSHARGQYLHVTQGIARFGDRDGIIVEVPCSMSENRPVNGVPGPIRLWKNSLPAGVATAAAASS
ncbi:hypothetical protein [Diaminobutyricibacter sp. McL0608]|uniref:hypothetical protein n=1 Tax=Leifsonia sp. McL0608 TaxID=3143537 RepID=UPI0031F31E4E